MKITGMSKLLRISVTASIPEPPSPRLMSARINPGRSEWALATASSRVAAVATRPQLGDEVFEVERDDWLVLDNHHAGSQLAVDGVLHIEDGRFDLVRRGIKNGGRFLKTERLDCRQKQGRALGGGQRLQPAFGASAGGIVWGFLIDLARGAGPDRVEQPVESNPRWDFGVQCLLAAQKCRKGGADIGVAARLRARQSPSIAAEKGKMGREGLRHAVESSLLIWVFLAKLSFGTQPRPKKFPRSEPSWAEHFALSGTRLPLAALAWGSDQRRWRIDVPLVTENRSVHLVSENKSQREKARAIRARQRAIGRELRRMYDDVAQESVPKDFLELLKEDRQILSQEGVVRCAPTCKARQPGGLMSRMISNRSCWL